MSQVIAAKPRRRWLQMRLRTLLVLTAVSGALLGWIAKERQQSDWEERFAGELRAHGGQVELADYFAWQPRVVGAASGGIRPAAANRPVPWWRTALQSLLGRRIIGIAAHRDYKLPSPDVAGFDRLTNLRRLDLGPQMDDLAPLARLTTLTALTVSPSTASGLTPLAGLFKLRTLKLSGSAASDVSPLSGLNLLENVDLGSTWVRSLGWAI